MSAMLLSIPDQRSSDWIIGKCKSLIIIILNANGFMMSNIAAVSTRSKMEIIPTPWSVVTRSIAVNYCPRNSYAGWLNCKNVLAWLVRVPVAGLLLVA
jgi:hypothetical protein